MKSKINITDEWDFGNDRLAEKLKELVLSGEKTATTGLWEVGDKIPKVGEYAGILDKNGKRFCIIQYTNVEVKSFLDVDFEFAVLEGEGDKNIEQWRQSHRKYFKKYYQDFSDQSLVVCSQFKLISVE